MMILLTGGSACGKSAYAESLLSRLPAPRYYLAAMRPYGDDGAARIERHRRLRAGKGFITVERYTDFAQLILPARGSALLECICNLTANEMFDADGSFSDPFFAVMSGVQALLEQCGDLLVVTNDVGSDGGGYDAATMAYVRALGRINAALAERADAVYELVVGIPLAVKGELP